jgi:hypothetical protein
MWLGVVLNLVIRNRRKPSRETIYQGWIINLRLKKIHGEILITLQMYTMHVVT